MADEPINNGDKEEKKKGTSINELVEEVERLLREVEEKEALETQDDEPKNDIEEEIKKIIETPRKNRRKKRNLEEIEEKEEETKVVIEEIDEKPAVENKKEIQIEHEVEEITEKEKIQDVEVIAKAEEKVEEKTVEVKKEKQKENKKESKEKDIVDEIIIEKEKKDSTELITIKGETKELTISMEQLEKIENEIKKQKDIPKQDREMINKELFKNLIRGVMIVFYFMVVIIGFFKLKEQTYLGDIRIFSGMLIAATIFIFEKAYRKESTDYMALGIETLILSIITLLTNYIYMEHFDKFPYIMNSFSMIFATYYVGKATIKYVKMKKKVLKKISDIRNIINRSK